MAMGLLASAFAVSPDRGHLPRPPKLGRHDFVTYLFSEEVSVEVELLLNDSSQLANEARHPLLITTAMPAQETERCS